MLLRPSTIRTFQLLLCFASIFAAALPLDVLVDREPDFSLTEERESSVADDRDEDVDIEDGLISPQAELSLHWIAAAAVMRGVVAPVAERPIVSRQRPPPTSLGNLVIS
ncbi:MAG: hypothetical protein U0892_23100 [Pirellulales bacterium]